MKSISILLLALSMVLSAPAAAPAAENANDLFQQALSKERTEGNLPEAIKLYQHIVDKFASNRKVAAQALLQMAECYQKLGDAQAQKIYERVVKDYADQKDAVALAQTALGSNLNASPGAVAKRLVCEDCGDNEAQLSPDGRLMVYTDWDSGDIAIRDISTGNVRRLFAKAGTYRDSGSDGMYPRLSPDLRQVVYEWEPEKKGDDDQLRLIQNDPGAKPRVLVDSPEIKWYEPIGWFPDNRSVLVLFEKTDETWQLSRVSVSDGSVKVLKSLEWRFNDCCSGSFPSISPDGKYIVYPALATNPDTPRPVPPDERRDVRVYVLASDGSSEADIVGAAGSNINCAWAPDGKHILFTSDRSGSVDLWSIAVENGKAVGPESLVSRNIGDLSTLGMHGGSYYYQPYAVRTDYVSIAEMRPAHEETQDAGRTAENFIGQSPSWSPDGKSIAFKRPRPGGAAAGYDLVVHSLETGEERAYRTSLGTTGGGTPLWLHDGKSVVTGFPRKDGGSAFYRIDLQTGDFKELPISPRVSGGLTADDKSLYQWHAQQIVSVALDTGQERPVFTLPAGTTVTYLRVSPDGRTLAFTLKDPKAPNQRRIACVEVDGSNYREVFATQPAYVSSENLAWTEDSHGILFELRKVTGDPFQIMRVSSAGGTPEPTGFEVTGNPIQSFDLSSSGSRIAISYNKKVHDLWALDNILSALK